MADREQKERRLREGGVGPEMLSSAGLGGRFYGNSVDSAREPAHTLPSEAVAVAVGTRRNYNSPYIRPLAVSPLTDPERVLSPWGFPFSASVILDTRFAFGV